MAGMFILLTIYVNVVKKPSLLICTIIRIIIGLMPVNLSVKTYIDTRSSVSLLLSAGTILCLFSDAIINLYFIPAVTGYMMAHICFMRAFHSIQKPSRKEWILYGVLVVPALCVIVFFSMITYRVRNVAVPVSIYAIVLFMMLISALPMEKLLKTGGILFALSDCMLGLRLALRIKDGWVSSIILFIYFTALAYIAAGCWQNCGSDTYKLMDS